MRSIYILLTTIIKIYYLYNIILVTVINNHGRKY